MDNKLIIQTIEKGKIAEELKTIDGLKIPQCVIIDIESGSLFKHKIKATDNPGHCPIIEEIANQCFRKKLEEGLAEYKAKLADFITGDNKSKIS